MTEELKLDNLTIEVQSEDTLKEVVVNKDAIEALMRKCYNLNNEKKALDTDLADKKGDLKELLNSMGITKIMTSDFTMSNVPSKRFSGWKDESALLELIPEDLRGLETMAFDRAKIEALVKAKKIPKAALELMAFNETKAIRFIPFVEKAKTD